MTYKSRASVFGIVLPLLLMAASACRLSPQTALPQGELTWLTDFVRARSEAKQAGKPLFVVFR
jgi:hypothetical protein